MARGKMHSFNVTWCHQRMNHSGDGGAIACDGSQPCGTTCSRLSSSHML